MCTCSRANPSIPVSARLLPIWIVHLYYDTRAVQVSSEDSLRFTCTNAFAAHVEEVPTRRVCVSSRRTPCGTFDHVAAAPGVLYYNIKVCAACICRGCCRSTEYRSERGGAGGYEKKLTVRRAQVTTRIPKTGRSATFHRMCV